MKIADVPRASSEQSREVIDQMLDDLQGLVDEFNETLPFAHEWAAMNRLRLELGDTVRMIEKSLGMREVTRNGVRVMSIESPPGHPWKQARSPRSRRWHGSRSKTRRNPPSGAVDPSSSTSIKKMMRAKKQSNNATAN